MLVVSDATPLNISDELIESTPGEGTAVRLTLPQADQAT